MPQASSAKKVTSTAGPRWAIVLHGGAGTIPRDQPQEVIQSHRAALRDALRRGVSILEQGGTSLDAVEQVIRALEDAPMFNAGRGAVFTHERTHELDASLMDGRTLACGAVAGVTTIRHPITAARLVMEKTRHVLLVGPGADRFADQMGWRRCPTSFSPPIFVVSNCSKLNSESEIDSK